ncbi:MAG: DNA-processing protein DprA [Pseudomonadales bacterium]|nr:DNA-processing protein DprA [Pseudomonadales bacterium]MCP5357775.1 DNA-protecting protein DprA [Pseudomonadales bacterium]
MMERNLEAWLALYHQDILSDRPLHALLQQFGSAELLLAADVCALVQVGLTQEKARDFVQVTRGHACRQQIERSLCWLAGADNRAIVPLSDPCYPPLLREIHDPPLLLFVQGALESLLLPQVAIVGSRRCSVDGRRNARYFGNALAARGFSLCSGMARGIDTAAHEAALEAGAYTVAVTGTGADQCYPPQNRRMAQRICERGAVITELPLGSVAKPTHFPKRNRIISGMSLGVMVIEAATRSGSLITARLALEHNRELFAVPGSIHNPLSAGPHRLIQQGAVLADDPVAVTELFCALLTTQTSLLPELPEGAKSSTASGGEPVLEADARHLIKAMGFDPVVLEVLVERTGMSLSQVQMLLLELELRGVVTQNAGHYVRC